MTNAHETTDQTFRRIICEHFDTDMPQRYIDRMGPTWYAEGIKRVKAGAETVDDVFGTKWKLKP